MASISSLQEYADKSAQICHVFENGFIAPSISDFNPILVFKYRFDLPTTKTTQKCAKSQISFRCIERTVFLPLVPGFYPFCEFKTIIPSGNS